MQKPETGECNPYFDGYLSLTGTNDFAETYAANTRDIEEFFEDIPEGSHDYAYEEGKWTIRQLLQHLIDMERVMAYRAMMIVRNAGKESLASVDENRFAENADVSLRGFDSMISEFKALRLANKYFFESLSDEESKIKGSVAGYPTTARALGYIIIGHATHHKRIIVERYL